MEIVYDRKRKAWIYDGQYFPSKNDARLDRLPDYPGGSLALYRRVEAVIEKYPMLDGRALNAGELVAMGHCHLLPGQSEFLALVDSRSELDRQYLVEWITKEERFTCDCKDWPKNAPVIIVRYGKPQQVCKHVLAAILADWETWGTYLVQVPR